MLTTALFVPVYYIYVLPCKASAFKNQYCFHKQKNYSYHCSWSYWQEKGFYYFTLRFELILLKRRVCSSSTSSWIYGFQVWVECSLNSFYKLTPLQFVVLFLKSFIIVNGGVNFTPPFFIFFTTLYIAVRKLSKND